MSEPFLSEIRIFSFNFAPRGWALCNGQTLPISQNAALFSLMGTTYGGNGTSTFQLPNLQGRIAMHMGSGFTEGQFAGESGVTLNIQQIPQHTHQAMASPNAPNANVPTGNYWASNTGDKPYGTAGDTTMAPGALPNVGGSQPHENRSPFLVLNFCIAMVGIFPSRA